LDNSNDPRAPRRRATRRRRSSARASYLPLIALAVLGFMLAGLAGAGAYFLPLLQTTATTAVESGSIPLPNPVDNGGPSQPFTVLLLGSDDDSKFPADRVLTQSMILVRVDPGKKTATMLSIPRDLWVTIPGQKEKAKIDTAYEQGGANGAVDAVEQNFQVHVDDYVWIGLNGLIHLIDRMGGVDVTVTNPVMDDFYPADIDTNNPYGYYRVAVLPGAVHMDGVHALQYVRSRHGDLRGDFARSERQQQVLLALRAESKSISVADLPSLVSAFSGEVKTSISVDRVRSLVGVAAQFGTSGVKQIVLLPPYTSPSTIGDQDVILPNWNLILPLVHQTFP
jgi:LCP family protein required for cell wall assembly